MDGQIHFFRGEIDHGKESLLSIIDVVIIFQRTDSFFFRVTN